MSNISLAINYGNDSSKEPLSDLYQDLTVVEPGTAYYIIYSLFAALGIAGNLLLLYSIRNRFGPFGERHTFTFLVKFICILDLILSCTIFIDISLLNTSVSLKTYDYFVHPRNVVLTIESYALLLIAFDRYLAIKRPYSQRWNCYFVYRIFGCLIAFTVIFDITSLVLKHCSSCSFFFQITALFIYIGVYTLIYCLIMVLTYTMYLLLFIAFMKYTEYNSCRNHRSSTIRLREVDSPADIENLNADNVEHRARWNYRRRLARTLFIVTFVYSSSMVPHILAGWEIIPFPGYLIYDLFYLNAIANPFIYISTDAHFRRDFLKHFFRSSRPASAVQTTSRVA